MKFSLLLASIIILAPIITFGQGPIKMLIYKSSNEVEEYFNELFSKKSNPYYKVEKSVNDNGDLILTAEFSIDDESYYKSLGVSTVFIRGNGKEICHTQLIWGNREYAYDYLSYIKDNFIKKRENTWEMPVPENSRLTYTIEAEYIVNKENSFGILFRLKKIVN